MGSVARYQITLTDYTDADALVEWYKLSSSSTPPSAPTTTDAEDVPTGWTTSEPTFDPSDSTTYYLYTCMQIVWGDGTCDWGSVQLSSSYEAAKSAYNRAVAAGNAAAAAKARYGSCSTGASTATKAVSCTGFVEEAGATITVSFSNASTSTTPKLSVNSATAKDIWVAGAVVSSTNRFVWAAGAAITFLYDGAKYVALSEPNSYSGACSTGASAAAKTDTTAIAGAVVCRGTVANMVMSNANTATSPTLNIGSSGAFDIQAKGGTESWEAGECVAFVFNGSAWEYDAVPAKGVADAAEAAKTASNYLVFDQNTGLVVGYVGSDGKVQINGSGVELYDGNGDSAMYAGLSGQYTIVRVGKAANGSGNIVMSSEGSVDIRIGSSIVGHIGYGTVRLNDGTTSNGTYYTFGNRKSGSDNGAHSMAAGGGNEASGFCSFAEGYQCQAIGGGSHAEGAQSIAGTAQAQHGYVLPMSSHAEGYKTESKSLGSHSEGYLSSATGFAAHAEGSSTQASGDNSHASGDHTVADKANMFVCGAYNQSRTGAKFQVGGGSSNGVNVSRYNLLDVYYNSGNFIAMFDSSHTGNVMVNGNVVHSSDRRLKQHVRYLDEDEYALDFVRDLKPALYVRDGERQVGFYAQDVDEADVWDTSMVFEQDMDDKLGYAPLMLNYTSIIAPLVSYTQALERRVEELERRVGALEGR